MVPNWAYRLATFCTRPSVTLLLMDSLSVSYAVATARPASPLPCWEIQESLPFFTAAKDATATLCLPSVCMGDGPPQGRWETARMVKSKRHTRFTFCKKDKNRPPKWLYQDMFSTSRGWIHPSHQVLEWSKRFTVSNPTGNTNGNSLLLCISLIINEAVQSLRVYWPFEFPRLW